MVTNLISITDFIICQVRILLNNLVQLQADTEEAHSLLQVSK